MDVDAKDEGIEPAIPPHRNREASILMVIAAICYSLQWLYVKLASRHVDSWTITSFQGEFLHTNRNPA